jgi:hypothetical protein
VHHPDPGWPPVELAPHTASAWRPAGPPPPERVVRDSLPPEPTERAASPLVAPRVAPLVVAWSTTSHNHGRDSEGSPVLSGTRARLYPPALHPPAAPAHSGLATPELRPRRRCSGHRPQCGALPGCDPTPGACSQRRIVADTCRAIAAHGNFFIPAPRHAGVSSVIRARDCGSVHLDKKNGRELALPAVPRTRGRYPRDHVSQLRG